MKTIIYQVCFGIPNLTKMDYHKLIKLFHRPIHTNVPSVKPQPKGSITKIAIDPETQNCLSTLELGDTVRI